MTVYFDNAATTQVCSEAAQEALRVMTENYGNPSSSHELGRNARRTLENARETIAACLGSSTEEVYFTSGGTEADNWAILGAAGASFHRGKHMITTAAEHDAVRKPAEYLKTKGWEVTYLMPDKTGCVSAEEFENSIREDTVLASVMLVNNEIGAINPVQEINRIIKRRGGRILLHVDAVQAFCKMPFTVKNLGADLVSVSAHKIHGMKGAGALFVKNGTKINPIIMGGGQEKGKRPGTEALPAIASFATAAEMGKKQIDASEQKVRLVRDTVVSALTDALPECRILSGAGSPYVLSISLPGYKSEVLMNYLEAEGICVSKSSACKKGGRSHVLEAMRLPSDVIDGAIRLSFCRYNTPDEAKYFVEKLREAGEKLYKKL